MTEKNRKAAEELVKPFLEAAANRTGVDTVYYMATDTPSESTELFWYGNMAEEYARRAFGRAPEAEGYFYLPGVVSRKKQMIPPLRMAMQAEP